MEWLDRWRRRARVLLRKSEVNREMADEMSFHLKMEAEDLVRVGGLSPAEARRRARLAFGGVELFQEDARRVASVHSTT